MKLRNKKTGEIREARIVNEHLQLWSTDLEDWFDYDDLDYLAKWWERYEEPKTFWANSWAGEPEEYDAQKTPQELQGMCEQIGNYFETKEEAEKAVERLKALKRLRDKGFEFEGIRKLLNEVIVMIETEWDYCPQVEELKRIRQSLFGDGYEC